MCTRWAVRYAVAGDARFLSHREVMRLWQRAGARAGLPLAFTGGFNPHPRMSYALARPVGVASRCEGVALEFTEPLPDASWLERLRPQLPPGWGLLEAAPAGGRRGVRVRSVRYEMALAAGETAGVSRRLDELKAMDRWCVARNRPADRGESTIDVKPSIEGIGVEGGRLCFRLLTGGGSGGPAEVLRLLGFGEGENEGGRTLPGLSEGLARLTRTEMDCQF